MKDKNVHYLQYLLDNLRLTASMFAKSIGYTSPNKIYYILRFRNGVSAEVANDIISEYPDVSYTWLLTGVGSMFNDTNGKIRNDNITFFPLVRQSDIEQYRTKFNNYDYILTLERSEIKTPVLYDKDRVAFEIFDRSMVIEGNSRGSLYPNDSIIAIDLHLDFSRIRPKKEYVIITSNKVYIRYCEIKGETLRIYSEDSIAYPDEFVEKKDVLQILEARSYHIKRD